MITKQAIRRGTSISSEGLTVSKEEVIALSEKWSEKEENLFRKSERQKIFNFIDHQSTVVLIYHDNANRSGLSH